MPLSCSTSCRPPRQAIAATSAPFTALPRCQTAGGGHPPEPRRELAPAVAIITQPHGRSGPGGG
eukprot:6668655-Alexandrium_andersonii.AAC.1